MAELIVLTFDDEDRGRAAYEEAQGLDERSAVLLDGLAHVRVDEHGKTHVESPARDSRVGARAASSAVFGTVLGFLFLMPLIGLVVGGVVGVLFAGLDRAGLDASFRRELADQLGHGGSAVVAYATPEDSARLVDALARFGGTVLRTTVSDQDEREIAHDPHGPR